MRFLEPFWIRWVSIHFWRCSAGSTSIFGDVVLLGFHVGSPGAPFLNPADVQIIEFHGLGLTLDSFFTDFSGPRGSGKRSRGISVLQGRPGSILGAILGAKWDAKGAQMPPKID